MPEPQRCAHCKRPGAPVWVHMDGQVYCWPCGNNRMILANAAKAKRLTPCPWCGGRARNIEPSSGGCAVRCSTCGAQGPTAKDVKAAGAKWDQVASLVQAAADLDVQAEVDCPTCEGHGFTWPSGGPDPKDCADCNGEGVVSPKDTAPCPDCHGSGNMRPGYPKYRCQTCLGTGRRHVSSGAPPTGGSGVKPPIVPTVDDRPRSRPLPESRNEKD